MMTILVDDILGLLLALLIGGLIGAEREFRQKEAGLRMGSRRDTGKSRTACGEVAC